MAELTELLIPFAELRRISFKCRKCKTETTLDRREQPKRKWNDSQRLPQCSICGEPPSEQLRQLLTNFLNEWPEEPYKEDFRNEEVYFKFRKAPTQ